MNNPNGLDMSQIMNTFQQITKDLAKGGEKGGEIKMDEVLDKLTDTVFSTMEKSGKQIDPASKNQLKNLSKNLLGSLDLDSLEQKNVPNSKIHIEDLNEGQKLPAKNTEVEMLESDSDVDELQPRVRSIHYDLDVTLEDLYIGKTKKMAVNRKRLVKGTSNVKEEKVKLEIPILPGMKDGQEIRFNYQGNEKPGYDTGDIVITLNESEHNYFQRSGNNLYIVRNISLYESYAAANGNINVVVQHLNGNYMVIQPDGKPLHTNDGGRKLKGFGMPILKKHKDSKQEYGDLYIRFNLILPESFETEETTLKILEKMFPILESNKDSTIFKDYGTKQILKKGFEVPSKGVIKVYMSDVTPEDLEQIEYDSDNEESESSESSESSGSESDSD